jgi:hypothetical protein
MMVIMSQFSDEYIILKGQFTGLLYSCDFGKPRPFIYRYFEQTVIDNYITSITDPNQIREGGSEAKVANVLQSAMNDRWGLLNLVFQTALSSLTNKGDFSLVFDNDDYRVYIVGGWQVNAVWNMKVEPTCTFPVLIIFKPHSNCICC